MLSNETQGREREQRRELNSESEPVKVRAGQEAQDAHTIYVRLMEPSAAEVSGDFSAQIEACKAQLNQYRTAYVQNYAGILEARRNKQPITEIEQLQAGTKSAHRDYVKAKKTYAEVLVSAHKIQLEQSGTSVEDTKIQLNAFIQTEIFNTLIVQEEVLLQEQKAAVHPPETKGVLRRMYERWDGLSTIQKGLITTALATGTAFVSTALARGLGSMELTAVALLFSKSFLMGISQEFVAGFTALGVNTLLEKKIQESFTTSVEQERQRTRVQTLELTSLRYKELLEKKSTQGSQALIVSALTMLATGRAFSLGLDFLSQTQALKGMTEAVATTFQSGPDIVGKLSDSETLGKPAKGFFKRILSYFDD